MKSCDTNILIYYLDSSCSEHNEAKLYLEKVWTDKEFIICDLVLIELYVLLRNPKVFDSPFTEEQARKCILKFRTNPYWKILEYSAGTMEKVWDATNKLTSKATTIYDLRLGFCLLNSGVKEFATRNTKDFKRVPFEKIINPID
jgi:toxin-antitoxin system PIN domain toxin